MASENSPANSARIRLRGEVCALYRARAVDPEKKYRLSACSTALALQGLSEVVTCSCHDDCGRVRTCDDSCYVRCRADSGHVVRI